VRKTAVMGVLKVNLNFIQDFIRYRNSKYYTEIRELRCVYMSFIVSSFFY
jgi:hypothetical protein